MEFTQLESRIAFLDSQYRREKADLAQLRHRIDLREGETEELAKRIDKFEAEILEIKSELQRISVLEDRIERFKSEVLTALENQQNRQKQAIKDVERNRVLEIESLNRSINDVRREIERGKDLDELITLARTETERQSAILVTFQQRLDQLARQNDEQLRAISYLEEQRGSDTRRVSELRAEMSDLFKRTNLQISKIELLEQQIPQFGQFQVALEEVRERTQAEFERSQYQVAEVDRKIKSWEGLSEAVYRRLDEYETRLERYAEHYQLNRKTLESLQGFQEAIRRDQHEFIELQRLAVDRQQSQREQWETEQEQIIRNQTIEAERRFNEIVKEVKQFQEQYTDVLPRLDVQDEQLTLLLRIMEEDAIARAISARDWQDRFEKLATDGDGA